MGCLCNYMCYQHRYICACAYMHIFDGDGFYEHFMILFFLYHLHNITTECPYHICVFNLCCRILNALCHILTCMLILPEMCLMYHHYHMLCQQWRNKDVQSIIEDNLFWFLRVSDSYVHYVFFEYIDNYIYWSLFTKGRMIYSTISTHGLHVWTV